MMEIVTSMVLVILGIVVLVTIHICMVGRSFGRGDGPNNDNNNNSGNILGRKSKSMSEDEIKKLPCFDYKGVEEEEEEEEMIVMSGKRGSSKMEDCAVCLESFKEGDKCRLLPKCKHSFHAQCIDSWLVKNGVCPICRAGADNDDDIELQRFSGESSNSSGVGGVELT